MIGSVWAPCWTMECTRRRNVEYRREDNGLRGKMFAGFEFKMNVDSRRFERHAFSTIDDKQQHFRFELFGRQDGIDVVFVVIRVLKTCVDIVQQRKTVFVVVKIRVVVRVVLVVQKQLQVVQWSNLSVCLVTLFFCTV